MSGRVVGSGFSSSNTNTSSSGQPQHHHHQAAAAASCSAANNTDHHSSTTSNGYNNHNKQERRDDSPSSVTMDLDDAKYDRKLKAALLRRRKRKRSSARTAIGGSGLLSSWTGTTHRGRRHVPLLAATVVVTAVGVWILYAGIHRRLQTNRHRAHLQRLERAEALWKERQAKEFDQVAPHRAGATTTRSKKKTTGFGGMDELLERFAELRTLADQQQPGVIPKIRSLLETWLDYEDLDVRKNVHQPHPRWIRPYLLPPHPEFSPDFRIGTAADDLDVAANNKKKRDKRRRMRGIDREEAQYFKVYRNTVEDDPTYRMTWEDEYEQLLKKSGDDPTTLPGPPVDYTAPEKYVYPPLPDPLRQPPPQRDDGDDGEPPDYPALRPLGELLQDWPQDEDRPGGAVIHETLLHFNYSDPAQRSRAQSYRDAELPFKLYGVPELDAAAVKWTDDYVGHMFGDRHPSKFAASQRVRDANTGEHLPVASGTAQESPNNYFAFYVSKAWDLNSMGLPPTRNNDWSFSQWSQHAVYADAVNLTADRPHFYWQSGVPPEERYKDRSQWTFITRDLPSFSSRKENFFVFHPDEQKGIQCRFGERGVVAATHFDGGRNMVAMIQGAKRYILSPPNQCSRLGIFTQKRSPIYRHSLLNFGHIRYLQQQQNNDADPKAAGMSLEERRWLERAAKSQALETVLKRGEVLYIPSHWFHYIVSLQKSAQCNVRSGVDMEGHRHFGGRKEVEECID